MHQELDINDFLDQAVEIPVVDVRTPAEFFQGHIPSAHNIPLFSNEERKSVGTTYKKKGRQHAILEGLDYSGPRLRSYIVRARKFARSNRLLVHCWRGGMRSAGMAWLFTTYGLQCHTLKGGYKSFRREALSYLKNRFPFVVIGGLTGSGKSEVLRSLARSGDQILDLEGFSHHKGSAFGHLGETEQNTNEQFENDIFRNLRGMDKTQIIWIEDESRNIGRNTLPAGIYQGIRSAPVLFLDVPLEERIRRLVGEYSCYPADMLVRSIERISSRLGGNAAREASQAVRSGDYARTAELVLGYYDKTYTFGLSKRDQSMVYKITADVPLNIAAITGHFQDLVREYTPSWNLFN
jgi:tRNA 2-selenouridine synthase